MALSSINGSYISTALAQARVAADESRVNGDQARLQEDRRQLQQDQSRLAQLRGQTGALRQTQASQALQTGVEQLTHNPQAASGASQATLNGSGQVVGRFVNVVA